MALAKARAPQVLVAQAGYQASEAKRVGARLAPIANPYLEVFLDRGREGVTKDVNVAANLWLPVELSGQRRQRIAETEAFIAWQGGNLEAAQAAAMGRVVLQYGEAVVADARVRTFADIETFARHQASILTQRLQRGDATRQDTTIAETELARVVVTLDEGRADLTRALTQLSTMLGRAVATPAQAQRESPPPPRDVSAAAIQRAVQQAPLIAAYGQQARYHQAGAKRAARTAQDPVNLILSGGRGDLGEQRWGGGISWTFPFWRRGQGEQSERLAERQRALTEADIFERVLSLTLDGLYREWSQVRAAVDHLDQHGMPAALAAVDAAMETLQAGKGEFLLVLTAQRDRSALALRRLELIRRQWSLLGDIVAITGALP